MNDPIIPVTYRKFSYPYEFDHLPGQWYCFSELIPLDGEKIVAINAENDIFHINVIHGTWRKHYLWDKTNNEWNGFTHWRKWEK